MPWWTQDGPPPPQGFYDRTAFAGVDLPAWTGPEPTRDLQGAAWNFWTLFVRGKLQVSVGQFYRYADGTEDEDVRWSYIGARVGTRLAQPNGSYNDAVVNLSDRDNPDEALADWWSSTGGSFNYPLTTILNDNAVTVRSWAQPADGNGYPFRWAGLTPLDPDDAVRFEVRGKDVPPYPFRSQVRDGEASMSDVGGGGVAAVCVPAWCVRDDVHGAPDWDAHTVYEVLDADDDVIATRHQRAPGDQQWHEAIWAAEPGGPLAYAVRVRRGPDADPTSRLVVHGVITRVADLEQRVAIGRVFPRDDGRGLSGAPRTFPPARSQQASNRRGPGGYL